MVGQSRTRWLRLALVVLLGVGLFVLGRLTGWTDELDTDRVRALVRAAGPWGFLLYLAVFAGGELAHVPGMVFVAAAVLIYGPAWGILAGFVGALVSVSVSFVVVRTLGGQPLAALRSPRLARLLAQLEAHPLRTVALLRALLWMAPALNYALAVSSVRFRDYLLGSAVGLVVPIAVAGGIFGWLIP